LATPSAKIEDQRGAKNMAASWGLNTLAAGASAGWFFSRPYKNGFLPVLSVEPQSGPDQSPATWSAGGSAYPTFNKLGVSTIWSNQTNAPEGSATFNITYYLVVSNNTDNDIAYSFLEADL
jgi:hypothetical protein